MDAEIKEKPVGASIDGRLGAKPAPRFPKITKKPFSPQENHNKTEAMEVAGIRQRGFQEGTKTKGKGWKKGMSKTPGNITPGKQIETRSGSNYQGRNFDPSFVPWAMDNRMKGKGKEKG